MKLTLQEKKNHELEVTIIYPRLDTYVKRLIKRINDCSRTIPAYSGDRTCLLEISNIYYIETVERKVFIYTEHTIYRSGKKLHQLEAELLEYGFSKANKACLININVLKTIRNINNSRLEAELINGEKINVSRTYIKNIKEAFL